jgi:hypothetical protein
MGGHRLHRQRRSSAGRRMRLRGLRLLVVRRTRLAEDLQPAPVPHVASPRLPDRPRRRHRGGRSVPPSPRSGRARHPRPEKELGTASHTLRASRCQQRLARLRSDRPRWTSTLGDLVADDDTYTVRRTRHVASRPSPHREPRRHPHPTRPAPLAVGHTVPHRARTSPSVEARQRLTPGPTDLAARQTFTSRRQPRPTSSTPSRARPTLSRQATHR